MSSSASVDQKKPSYQLCRPHLSVKTSSVDKALAFYKDAFGAQFVSQPVYSTKRKADGTRVLLMAHLKFGLAEFLLSELPEERTSDEVIGAIDNTKLFTNVILHVATDDMEGAVAKAKAAGAEDLIPAPATEPGIRYVMLKDPLGFAWGFGDLLWDDEEQQEVQSTAGSKIQEAYSEEE